MMGNKKKVRRFWRKYLRSFLGKSQWPIVLGLGVMAIYFGYVGFAKYFAVMGEKRSFWDLFYLSLQLFTLESGSIPGPKPWELELARLLAPSLAAFAAIKALMAIFRDQVLSFRTRLTRNHVVICGLGQKGYLLAKGFHDSGYRVVAVEKDENNSCLEQCREYGVIIIIGDATRREVLHSARAHKAKYLISVCGDDGTNVETSLHAFDFVKRRKNKPLSCFIHINDPQLCNFLGEAQILTEKTDSFELEFFSIYDSGARALLRYFPPFNESRQNPKPHVVVVGLGRMGRSIVVHAARMWRSKFDKIGKPMRFTIIDKEAKSRTKLLDLRYPRLNKICNLIPYQMDVKGPEFQEAAFLFESQVNCDMTSIYVCFDDDSLGLATALTLFQRIRDQKPNIVVRMKQTDGLAKLIGKTTTGLSGFENIHAFGLLDRACQPEHILGGIHEVIARALHETYVRQQKRLGYTVETNPSMAPWEELSEFLKESNRSQANHIGVKLKSVGCGIALLTDWDAELFNFTPQEIEIMAKMEHERWMKDLKTRGWSYAKGEKDPSRKKHPYLVPWEELPEEIRGYDRDFIRELPKILADVDLQIYRIKRTDEISK